MQDLLLHMLLVQRLFLVFIRLYSRREVAGSDKAYQIQAAEGRAKPEDHHTHIRLLYMHKLAVPHLAHSPEIDHAHAKRAQRL